MSEGVHLARAHRLGDQRCHCPKRKFVRNIRQKKTDGRIELKFLARRFTQVRKGASVRAPVRITFRPDGPR